MGACYDRRTKEDSKGDADAPEPSLNRRSDNKEKASTKKLLDGPDTTQDNQNKSSPLDISTKATRAASSQKRAKVKKHANSAAVARRKGLPLVESIGLTSRGKSASAVFFRGSSDASPDLAASQKLHTTDSNGASWMGRERNCSAARYSSDPATSYPSFLCFRHAQYAHQCILCSDAAITARSVLCHSCFNPHQMRCAKCNTLMFAADCKIEHSSRVCEEHAGACIKCNQPAVVPEEAAVVVKRPLNLKMYGQD
eukprot:gnl/Hemi2/11756_TR4035_c0_g1_i2.p1 gnl/Hemi2/11756_TR4035_c0_g1~~gnl/Hemi2/11756_TR4035_c0_g1_i2.p1  ORF type:complete len:254 (-),score=0.92 gnl/Hemi2/11756_TR4035_c0_g1_i2:172-933(-)